MAGRTITCPQCGNRGLTFDQSSFETRGTYGRNGMPVRMCVACGSGMTVHPSLIGAKAKLIDPVTWESMKQSWDRQFGGQGEEDGEDDEDDWLDQGADDGSEYPVVSCPYCGNTGSTEPGSVSFEYRVSLGEPKARMCRKCERGFWMHSETGETEPMSDETWAGLEMMHATLGGGAEVAAEWARRAATPEDDEEDASELADEADEIQYQAPRIVAATAGEPVALRGSVLKIVVTLLEVQDPGRIDEDIVEPEEGLRYVGIRLRIENTGDEEYYETPSMEATLIAQDGEEYKADIGWLEPELDAFVTLDSGETAEGFLTFEVPEKMRLAAFRYTYSVKTPPEAAEWKL